MLEALAQARRELKKVQARAESRVEVCVCVFSLSLSLSLSRALSLALSLAHSRTFSFPRSRTPSPPAPPPPLHSRTQEHQDTVRTLSSKLDTQTAAADTLQALFASTCSQLASAFPLGPLQEDRDQRERDADGSRTPPYPANPAAFSATPLAVKASARRLALPIPGDKDDPLKWYASITRSLLPYK